MLPQLGSIIFNHIHTDGRYLNRSIKSDNGIHTNFIYLSFKFLQIGGRNEE